MLGILPDLTPRDSHSVWYASSRNPLRNPLVDPSGLESSSTPSQRQQQQHQQSQSQSGDHHRGGRHHHHSNHGILLERSQLARLRADEHHLELRRANVQNFGAGWLKPPGVPKTLHQMREEQREAAEHAEAVRREQMQAELAEAEATGAEGLEGTEGMDEGDLAGHQGAGGDLDADGMAVGSGADLDDMGDGARDLDEDIPDADASGMGLSAIESDSSDDATSAAESDEDDEEGEEEDEETREERRNELVQARMRMADDAFRQAIARGDADAGDMYGAEEELEAEDEGQLLLEEDARRGGFRAAARRRQLQHPHLRHRQQQLDHDEHDLDANAYGEQMLEGEDEEEDLDMDADLDGSVPDGTHLSGVYEHTDSEAELSSSDDANGNSPGRRSESDDDDGDLGLGFAPRSSIGGVVGGGELRPPTSPTLGAAARVGGSARASGGPNRTRPSRRSMDLSSLLSGGDSSVLGSSPPGRGGQRR